MRSRPLTKDSADVAGLSQCENGRLTGCAAIVVTYFPTPENLGNLLNLSRQFALTIVVDNASTAETRRELENIGRQDSRIRVQLLSENIGLSAGCNMGIAVAAEAGFGWMAIFDQDTEVPADFAQSIAKSVESKAWPGNVALVSPRHVHPKTGAASAYYPSVKSQQAEEIGATILSGSIVNLAAHQRIGGFSETLFVDFVDYDYCFRLKECGFRLIQLESVVLLHRIGERECRRLLGVWPIQMHVHSPLRHYYLLRDRLYCMTRHGSRHPRWMLREIIHGTGVFVVSVLTDREALKCLKYGLSGIRDALRGRTGRFDAGH